MADAPHRAPLTGPHGESSFQPPATALSITVAVILIAMVLVAVKVFCPSSKNRTRVDTSARSMASTKDLAELQEKRSLEKAPGSASRDARVSRWCRSSVSAGKG